MPVWHRFTARSDASVPRRGLPQEVAIAGSGHPSRSRQMAVMDAARALRLKAGVNPEQDLDRLGPVRAIGGGIEEPHVKLDVGPVVSRQFLDIGRGVLERLDQPAHDEHPGLERAKGLWDPKPGSAIGDERRRTEAVRLLSDASRSSLFFSAMNKQHSLSAFG